MEAFLGAIQREFRYLRAKLQNNGITYIVWAESLEELRLDVAQEALRRWVSSREREPTLDQFLIVCDDIKRERAAIAAQRRTHGEEVDIGVILERCVSERTPGEKAWGSGHCWLFQQFRGKTRPKRKEIARRFYEMFAERWPEYENLCYSAARTYEDDRDEVCTYGDVF